MKRTLTFSFLAICLTATISLADTIVPGGNVSGFWNLAGSPYLIEGGISIPTDETLSIAAGVEVIFQGHYKFNVHGVLTAVGTESDSILFTAADTVEGWHGIRFSSSSNDNQLSYCIIQYGRAFGTDSDQDGGGVHCYYSDPTIEHCTIHRNSAGRYSGGIHIER